MAKTYYLSSAQQDSPDAQAALGILLVDDRQYDTGLKWLHDAARMVIQTTQKKNMTIKLTLPFFFGVYIEKYTCFGETRDNA